MTLRFCAGAGQSRALAAWRAANAGIEHLLFHALGMQDLYQRQRGRCYICIAAMDTALRGRGRNLLAWTIDHVFPRAVGGRQLANLLLAHRGCNERKADRWPFPCEVIYLAAVYAAPHDALAHRAARLLDAVARADRRRAAIERMH